MATYPASATNNLYLTTSYGTNSLGGAIFSGKPDPTQPPPQLYLEYRSSNVNEVFFQLASDSRPYNPEFSVIVVSANGPNNDGVTTGKIYKSTRYGNDVGGWTEAYSTNTGDLYGCAYGNNTWVAVGQNNLVVRSTDGTTWTELPGAVSGGRWKWMCFGGGRFMAVGYKTIPDPSGIGEIDSGIVMYSDNDGLTWTQAQTGTNKRLTSVAYSPELNKFVAVGLEGTIIAVDGK
jgi:hypothetical protein